MAKLARPKATKTAMAVYSMLITFLHDVMCKKLFLQVEMSYDIV